MRPGAGRLAGGDRRRRARLLGRPLIRGRPGRAGGRSRHGASPAAPRGGRGDAGASADRPHVWSRGGEGAVLGGLLRPDGDPPRSRRDELASDRGAGRVSPARASR